MTIFLILLCVALFCELIDSGLGMMYGTIGTPILLIMGYEPSVVIPTILLSQALGGIIASIGHQHHKNADLINTTGKDFKASAIVYGLGIIAVIGGVFVGNAVPKAFLSKYISILVIVMGLVVVLKSKFKFSWLKISGISFISAFNKAMSGGGYGPLMTNGLIASGLKSKSSIAITDFAEIFICLTAFVTWSIFKGSVDVKLMLPLCMGASIGASIGPYLLSKLKSDRLVTLIVGYMTIILGIICMINPAVKL